MPNFPGSILTFIICILVFAGYIFLADTQFLIFSLAVFFLINLILNNKKPVRNQIKTHEDIKLAKMDNNGKKGETYHAKGLLNLASEINAKKSRGLLSLASEIKYSAQIRRGLLALADEIKSNASSKSD